MRVEGQLVFESTQEGRILVRNGYDGQIIRILVLQSVQIGNLIEAGGAPRGPKIQDNHFALVVGQLVLLPRFNIGKREFRSLHGNLNVLIAARRSHLLTLLTDINHFRCLTSHHHESDGRHDEQYRQHGACPLHEVPGRTLLPSRVEHAQEYQSYDDHDEAHDDDKRGIHLERWV